MSISTPAPVPASSPARPGRSAPAPEPRAASTGRSAVVLASAVPRRALRDLGPQAHAVTVREFHLAPGAATDWHYHRHPMLAVVAKGTLTYSEDRGRREVYPEGSAFVEHIDVVHRGENLGTRPLVLYLVHFLPSRDTPLAVPAAPGTRIPPAEDVGERGAPWPYPGAHDHVRRW